VSTLELYYEIYSIFELIMLNRTLPIKKSLSKR